MKKFSEQMIAIVCILTVGVMTVTPFVPSLEAHPSEVWWNYHLIVCCEYDGHYYTYCDHVRQIRLGYVNPEANHPSLNHPDHNEHMQSSRPDEYTSELKTVNNCNDCNL